MSATRVAKIHPSWYPNYDVLTGTRAGSRGFWRGPDIDAQPGQVVSPVVSRDIARQWLIEEGEVVPTEDLARAKAENDQLRAELEDKTAAVEQLTKRLTRVYPRRTKKVRA